VQGLISAGAREDASFAQAAAQEGPEVAAAMAGLARLNLGEEPEYVSCADYDQLWSGGDLVPGGGYGMLVQRFGAEIPVRLGTAVTRVDWSGPGVVLETAVGRVAARAALVTVPVGVIQAESIRFVPSLPAESLAGFDGLRMGAYTKIALRIDRAKLGGTALGDTIDLGGGRDLISFEVFPSGRDVVLAYLEAISRANSAGRASLRPSSMRRPVSRRSPASASGQPSRAASSRPGGRIPIPGAAIPSLGLVMRARGLHSGVPSVTGSGLPGRRARAGAR
jgi:hypothetical protein